MIKKKQSYLFKYRLLFDGHYHIQISRHVIKQYDFLFLNIYRTYFYLSTKRSKSDGEYPSSVNSYSISVRPRRAAQKKGAQTKRKTKRIPNVASAQGARGIARRPGELLKAESSFFFVLRTSKST